ncbi:MAG: RCC1 domain-containing protein [Acidimicrobiales bacterium]
MRRLGRIDARSGRRTHRGRVVRVAATGLAAAVGLAACGSSGGSGAQGTSTPVSKPTVVYTFGVAGTKGKVIQTQHDKPSPIPGIKGTVVQIATSNSTTYARTATGAVWAWGVASLGELGNGSAPEYVDTAMKVDFPARVKITSLANPMPFDAGLAIDSAGQAWGWGLNADHDLCLPGAADVLHPTQIDLPDVSLATGARTHSLFDSNGVVYACGDGSHGELGNGKATSSATPTAVVGLPKGAVKALTSSWGGSGALMEDGTYYNWGYNASGQMGDGTTADSPFPVRVVLPASVRQVFQGGSGPDNGQTLAILSNGSLWAWGNGKWGQLGNGSTTSSHRPISITLPDGARPATVATGGYASYAVDTTGRLWAWGRNNDGQLGTGGGEPLRLTPVVLGITAQRVSSTAQNVAALSAS